MKIYTQYEDTTVRTVDDFEGSHTATSWQNSTIGGSVSQIGLPAVPVENDLRTMDAQSPHLTAGLALRWNSNGEALAYTVPAPPAEGAKASAGGCAGVALQGMRKLR